MKCPNCGSDRVKSYTHSSTNTVVTERYKGYGCCKGFLGWLFFGAYGLLCGLCGMGKQSTQTDVTTRQRTKYVCLDCGKKFD